MKDLIRRSDAIEAVENVTWYHQNCNKDMVEGANSDEHQAWYKSQDIYEALEAVPSADRPQGEWIHEIDDMGIYRQHTVRCSNCKCGFTNAYVVLLCGDTGDLFRYCPHCGARMKGADDE